MEDTRWVCDQGREVGKSQKQTISSVESRDGRRRSTSQVLLLFTLSIPWDGQPGKAL